MSDRILLIRTGGTIDAPYERYKNPKDPLPAIRGAIKGKESLIMPAIAGLPNHENVDEHIWSPAEEERFTNIYKWKAYDSDNDNIAALADIIKNDTHNYFIITHPTERIANHAALLKQELQNSNKVVVFTGAMIPVSVHKKPATSGDRNYISDGIAILHFTLERIREQKPGIYVVARDAENKRLGFFNPQQVQKSSYTSQESLIFTVEDKGR